MKKILLLATVLFVFSCKKETTEPFGKPQTTTEAQASDVAPDASASKTPAQLGKEIFEGKGTCTTCHKVDQKTIGPSIQDIAKIYKEKKGDIVTFLKGNATAIVDPAQYEVMKANFTITKAMTDDELKSIQEYIYSNTK